MSVFPPLHHATQSLDWDRRCPYNLDVLQRSVVFVCSGRAHSFHHSHAGKDSTKDGVLPIQPRARRECNKKLTPVCVRTGICH